MTAGKLGDLKIVVCKSSEAAQGMIYNKVLPINRRVMYCLDMVVEYNDNSITFIKNRQGHVGTTDQKTMSFIQELISLNEMVIGKDPAG